MQLSQLGIEGLDSKAIANYDTYMNVVNNIHLNKGICQADIVSLESVSPGIITNDYPLYIFSVEPSKQNLDIAMEKIDFLKAGIIGAVIAAVVAFLTKIFKSGNRKDYKKDSEDKKKEFDKAEDKFDAATEAAKESSETLTDTDSLDDIFKDARAFFVRIGVDDQTAKTWTSDIYTLREQLFGNAGFKRAAIRHALNNCHYEIIAANDYDTIQDDLFNVVNIIAGEVVNRIDFIKRLTKFSEDQFNAILKYQHSSDEIGITNDMLLDPPDYGADIAAIVKYCEIKEYERGSRTQVATAFLDKVAVYFTVTGMIDTNAILGSNYFKLRAGDKFTSIVHAANTFAEYYNKEGINALELMRKESSDVKRSYYIAKEVPCEDPCKIEEHLRYIDSLLTDEIKVIAKISATINLIKNSGENILKGIEKATMSLNASANFMLEMNKRFKAINTKVSKESVSFMHDYHKALSVFDNTFAIAKEVSSLESSGVISRAKARELEQLCPTTISSKVSLESFSFLDSKKNYAVALEGLTEKLKEAGKAILEYIKNLITKVIDWIEGWLKKREANSKKKAQERSFYHGQVYTLDTKIRELFNKIIVILNESDKSKIILNKALHSCFTLALMKQPIGEDYSKKDVNDIIERLMQPNYNGGLDYIVTQLSIMMNISEANYAVLQGTGNPVSAFCLDTFKECERRNDNFASKMNNILQAIKRDERPEADIADHDAENKYVAACVLNLKIPQNDKTLNVPNDVWSGKLEVLKLISDHFDKMSRDPIDSANTTDIRAWKRAGDVFFTIDQLKEYENEPLLDNAAFKEGLGYSDKARKIVAELKQLSKEVTETEKEVKRRGAGLATEQVSGLKAVFGQVQSLMILMKLWDNCVSVITAPNVYVNSIVTFFRNFVFYVDRESVEGNDFISSSQAGRLKTLIKESCLDIRKDIANFYLSSH